MLIILRMSVDEYGEVHHPLLRHRRSISLPYQAANRSRRCHKVGITEKCRLDGLNAKRQYSSLASKTQPKFYGSGHLRDGSAPVFQKARGQ